VTALLGGEPGSKRAVVSFFQPAELTDPGNPDVSCTLGLQFLLRDQRLHAAAFISEPGLLYRKWPGQQTKQDAHYEPVERHARMPLIAAFHP
jgi:hypothetical protein